VSESGKLQIRFQGFNFLSRSVDTYQQYDSFLYLGFSNIAIAPDSVSTGGITTTRTGHRTVQLAAKYYF